MKKIVVLLLTLVLSGCGRSVSAPSHTHTFSNEWSYNKEYHWHDSTCGHDVVNDKASHQFLESVTDPTYEKDGLITYTCSICGYSYSEKGADKLEHHYSSSWSHNDYTHWHACIDTGYENLKSDEANHEFGEWVVDDAATCTEDGSKHRTCSICGAVVNDIIPAINHDYGDPSYSWSNDYSSCTASMVCKNDASHIISETAISTSVVNKPSCTEDGLVTYSVTFNNSSFKAQSIEVTVPVTGHIWGEPNYVWASDYSSVTASRLCKNDSNHVESETVSTTSNVTLEPTCTNKGQTTYTSASFSNEAFEVQSIVVDDIEATGHSYGSPTYLWSSDYSTCTASAVCSNDSSHIVSETVDSISEDLGDGLWRYTATFTDTLFETQIREIEKPTLDKLTFIIDDSAQYYWVKAASTSIEGKVVIPETYNDLPVTKINVNAFKDCTKIQSIIVPDSVREIWHSAFLNCNSLRSITLPFIGWMNSQYRYLGYIFGGGDYTYNGEVVPVTLKTVIISDSCTSIDSHAFYNCYSLTSIVIGNGVTSIGDGAFEDCSKLTSVELGSNVASFGNNAFKNCSSLSSFTIPDHVTYTGSSIFKDCSKLESIVIGSGVTYISNNAFENCSSLSSVTIPNSVTIIDKEAFKNCTSLESIVIPDSVTKIRFAAFFGCSSIITMTLPFIGGSATENQFLGYIFGASSYTESENYVPPSIRNVTISDSCSSLGDDAFYGCPFWVFNECDNALYLGNENNPYLVLYRAKTTSITSCEINENCRFIYSGAFGYCSLLESITIPNSVTSIGYEAFFNCSSLSSVTLSNNLTSIKHGTFFYCSSLTSITIPDSVTTIDYQAFCECTALESVTLGNSVTSIRNNAFENCSSLSSINLPDSVTRIGEWAFNNCSSLSSITLGANIRTIGYKAFNNCSSLTTTNYRGTIDKWLLFSYESELKGSIHLFLDDSGEETTNIVIPDGVTSIEPLDFQNCSSITSVTIPSSVTAIKYGAFSGCSSLSTINFMGTVEQWNAVSLDSWNWGVPATVVHCSDGDVML